MGMKNILITGGAGFIGLALASSLTKRGVSVALLDLPICLKRVPAELPVLLIEGDVGDRVTYDRLRSGSSRFVVASEAGGVITRHGRNG